jgi:hypothetical protein
MHLLKNYAGLKEKGIKMWIKILINIKKLMRLGLFLKY